MPTLDIDMFDDTPHVGDNVKVLGEIKEINEDTGKVEVSYDEVKILDKDEKTKKRKKRRDYNNPDEEIVFENQMQPNTQTLDDALGQAFPNTQ